MNARRRRTGPNEHVQRIDGLSRGRHGGVVGHIELHESGTERLRRLLAALTVARADPDLMARARQLTSDLKAKAPVRTGDECRCHVPK
jgi:hypothetical protein